MTAGILIACMLILFAGLIGWAYGPAQKKRFDEAAALALVDDAPREETRR